MKPVYKVCEPFSRGQNQTPTFFQDNLLREMPYQNIRHNRFTLLRSDLPFKAVREYARTLNDRCWALAHDRAGGSCQLLVVTLEKRQPKARPETMLDESWEWSAFCAPLTDITVSHFWNGCRVANFELAEAPVERAPKRRKFNLNKIIKPWINDKAGFEHHVADLRINGDETMTDDDRVLLKHTNTFRCYRNAVQERESVAGFLNYPATAGTLALGKFQHLRELKVTVRVDGEWKTMGFLKYWKKNGIKKAFIFWGDSGFGKTALASALAGAFAVHRKTYWISSSTVDDFRAIPAKGYLGTEKAIVLDEWQPGGRSQDSRADNADFIKQLFTVQDNSGVGARFQNIRLSKHSPRLITSNTNFEGWIRIIESFGEEHSEAVYNRLAFVHVSQCLIPESCMRQRDQEVHRRFEEEVAEVFADAGLEVSSGDEA